MRLLLLVSALGVAHAQLSSTTPYPWPGQLVTAPDISVAVGKYEAANIAESSPAVGADGIVYFGSLDKYLNAVNAGGTLKWKYETGSNISGSSPAVGTDGTVYIGSWDKHLHAVNANGTSKWKYRTAGVIYSSPALGADGTVYVGSNDKYLHAVNADGTPKWKYETEGLIMLSSPVVGTDGTVYIGSWDKHLHAVNANGTSKWKYRTANAIHSSPALGADGTVYVGAWDNYLHAVNADGTPKWKYEVVSMYCSPAVDADGTVYIGSDDGYLHAVNANGTPKWKYEMMRREAGNSFVGNEPRPAVGADRTVYVGSGDEIYALKVDGTNEDRVKWKFRTGGLVRSPPAVGADDMVYDGSTGKFLYVIGPSAAYVSSLLHLAQRSLARNETAQPQLQQICDLNKTSGDGSFSPEALNLIDTSCQIIAHTSCSSPAYRGWRGFATPLSFTEYKGGVIVITGSGDDNNNLYGIGVSAGLVASSLHSAQRALASFDTKSAVSQLQRLCDFKSSIHGESSGFDDFTIDTVKLIDTSCQLLANTRNSPSYGRAWENFVTPLSFTEYKDLISAGGTMMKLLQRYEEHLHDFKAAEATIDDRIATAKDALKGHEADEANWQDVLQRDKADMSAYGKQIVTIGQQMDSKYEMLQTDVLKLINRLNDQLKGLKKALEDAKDEDERKKVWSVFSAIFNVGKAVVSVAACFGASVETFGAALLACGEENIDAIKGAVGSITDCVNTLQSSCKKCDELSAEIEAAKHAEQEINALANMTKAAQALNAQLSTGKALPEELPLLISESISMETLRADAEVFRQELVKEAGADGGRAFVNDIRDWTQQGITRVSLFLSYYNLATRVQNDEGQLAALQTHTNIVQDRLEDEQNKEAAVISAAFLMYERQQTQAMRIVKYLHEEVKQYEYFALKKLLPPIELSGEPQLEDILSAQQRIDQVYTMEMEKQSSGRNLAWIYIEVNEAAEPSTFRSMRKSASTSVVLPIPLKSDPNLATNAVQQIANTTYNQMRIHNAAVYLLDKSGVPLGDGPVQVKLEKSGISSFFDSNMDLHTFTHAPVKLGAGSFVYSSKTGCPLSEDDCGALCADYIRYSPFGKWNLAVDEPTRQGVDLSKLASIRFQFQVDYGSGGFSRNFFGKDPDRYPQNFGTRCLPWAEKDAASNEKDEI